MVVMSKYEIRAFGIDTGWVSIGGQWALGEARGYLRCHASTPGPRLALQVVRDDGRVVEESPEVRDVTLGAGRPTPEQYIRAATRAIVQSTAARSVHRGWSGRRYSTLERRLAALADCEQALAFARAVLADPTNDLDEASQAVLDRLGEKVIHGAGADYEFFASVDLHPERGPGVQRSRALVGGDGDEYAAWGAWEAYGAAEDAGAAEQFSTLAGALGWLEIAINGER